MLSCLQLIIHWGVSEMRLDLGPELEVFRDELRAWINERRPDGLEDLDERALYFAGDGLSGRAASNRSLHCR